MWDGYTEMLKQETEQRRIAQKAEVKRMRGSADANTQTILIVAEKLYQEERKETAGISCDFQERTPGFQMRLIQQAAQMLDTYQTIKEWLE